MKISKYTLFPSLIFVLLFLLPFFWFKSGEMDLGGDSSRLYFYDPISYLFSTTFYGVSASAFGAENINYFAIPFIIFLALLRQILSPTNLIASFHGFALSMSFLFCFLSIRELIDKETIAKNPLLTMGALVGGLAYALSPALIDGWEHVLISRNQIFLNPLFFFLLLRYLKTTNVRYLFTILLLSFIFSPNFSVIAAPAILAFYPLTILFLFLYTKFVLKRKIILQHLFISFFLFLCLQAFHILPQIGDVFSKGSVINTTIFSEEGKYVRGLSYFSAIVPNIKVSLNLLGLPQMAPIGSQSWMLLIFPFIIVGAYFYNREKTLPSVTLVFLILLFFATANITNVGLAFYKKLFDLPGFSIFRNFYGQWQFTYVFYYAVVLGVALATILEKIQKRYGYFLIFITSAVLLLYAIPFIKGDIVHRPLWTSKNVSSLIEMDPAYEDFLSFVKALPSDARILTLPLTDPGYQILVGENGGGYEGPSTIAYLAGKKDFSGIEEFAQFRNSFTTAIEKKDYSTVKNIFSLLHIKYIFHNSDVKIYDDTFPQFPYLNARDVLPSNQKAYKELLNELSLKKIYSNKTYSLYEVNEQAYLPHIYTPTKTITTNLTSNDWGYFLRNIEFANDRPILKIDPASNVYIQPNKVDIFTSIVKDFPISVIYPFSKWNPSSFVYPFIVFRENLQLNKFKSSEEAYIDRLLFLSAKRISELEKYAENLPISSSMSYTAFKEPKIWEVTKWYTYNSWNSEIARYYTRMNEAIATVDASTNNTFWKNSQKRKIAQNLRSNQVKTNIIIHNRQRISQDEKKTLFVILDRMFADFNKRVIVPEYDPTILEYEIPGIGEEESYDMFINSPLDTFTSIKINDEEIKQNGKTVNDQWTQYTSILLGKNPKKLSLHNNSQNIDTNLPWKKVHSDNILSELEVIQADKLITDSKNIGFIRHIRGLQPKTHYLISFEYITYGSEFEMSFYTKDSTYPKNGAKPKYTADFREPKNTREWIKFTAVVQPRGTADALFNINPTDKNGSLQQISIRNFSVYKLPSQPETLLKGEAKEEQNRNLPKLTFQRINPTKYEVHIENATAPYTLVLGENFSSKWKIIDPTHIADTFAAKVFHKIASILQLLVPTVERKSKINLISYDNGDIHEKESKNIFLNPSTFETWGKAEIHAEHFVANAYANAWYIEPKDTQGRKNYTLILEMDTQRLFYISGIISFCVFIATVFLFIRTYTKKQ